MRIHAAGNLAMAAPAAAPRRAARGGFALADSEAARSPAHASAPRSIGSLDALMALQAFEDPGERRRRSLQRGRAALDVLEELKVGILGGTLDAGALTRLKAVARTLGEDSGDAGLNAIMAEIELRAAVELAKLARE